MGDTDLPSNPYVGLRPFFAEDSLYFFGRRQQTTELLEILHQCRFLGTVGGSGCGKSSLLRAGLLPCLLGGFLTDAIDRWVTVAMKPGDAPIHNLARAFLEGAVEGPPPIDPAALAQAIRDDHVEAVVRLLRPSIGNQANVFLLVDQFEEVFSFRNHCRDDGLGSDDPAQRREQARRRTEAADFVDLLLSLAAQRELPIYVALTMRSDFLGDCDLFHGLPEALNRGRYLVPRLTRQQLREAIEGPARLMQARIAPRLLDHLLNRLGDRFDQLPILQHALLRTWDAWEAAGGSGCIDLQHYEAAGTLDRALDQDAEHAMEGLDESVTARIFKRLTDTDMGRRRVRSPARMSELMAASQADRPAIEAIVRRFRDEGRCFLYQSKDGKPEDPRVDISHESLIRQWNRLRGWVDEERDARDQYLELVARARKDQRGVGSVLQGIDLQRWRDAGAPERQWAERYDSCGGDFDCAVSFLDKSLEEDCETKAAAELERRWNRTWKPLILVVLVAVLGTLLWKQRKSVEDSAIKAHKAFATATALKAPSPSRTNKLSTPPEEQAWESTESPSEDRQSDRRIWRNRPSSLSALLLFIPIYFFLLYSGLEWLGRKVHRRYAFKPILDDFRIEAGLKTPPSELPDPAAACTTSYASSSRRSIGFLIDLALYLFLVSVTAIACANFCREWTWLAWLAACLVLNWLYETLPVASRWQATLGMRAVGIFRTDRHGGRLSFGRASLWYLCRLLTFGPLGLVLLPFAKRRQTVYDWLARTVVLARPSDDLVGHATIYARTLRRVAGSLMDSALCTFLVFVGAIPISLVLHDQTESLQGTCLVVCTILTNWLYHTLPLASAWQATLGMRAAGIFRTDRHGRRLSFRRASLWYLCRWLSILVSCLGFVPQPFTKRRQTLHDLIAGTVVFQLPATSPSCAEDATAPAPQGAVVPSSASLALSIADPH